MNYKFKHNYPKYILFAPLLLMGLSFNSYDMHELNTQYLLSMACSEPDNSSSDEYPWLKVSLALNEASKKHNIDKKLLLAVMSTESRCKIDARSGEGAIGLMQLMPKTARWLGVSNPLAVKDNIHGGAKYLSLLLDDFNGNVELALAAYNAGPTKVKRYKKIPPYKETQTYVKKVLAKYEKLRDAS